MGRPPIGRKAMTATDRQRRWRQKRRRQRLTGPEPRPAEPASRVAAEPASNEAAERIEDLERQLDHAHQQLELAHRGAAPEAAGHDYPHPCFICHRRRPEATGMVTAERRGFALYLCNRCIAEMRVFSDRIIANEAARRAVAGELPAPGGPWTPADPETAWVTPARRAPRRPGRRRADRSGASTASAADRIPIPR